MELQHEIFPDFYKKYEWVIQEEDKFFTGRKNYLENFWRDLCNVAGKGFSLRRNRAFIGPRKLGKTAFLHRCYNVAFWEQEEVIPFYYCFPQQNDINLRQLAQKIVFKFLQQAAVFVTKDNSLLYTDVKDIIFLELKKRKFKRLDHLEIYWEETIKNIENYEPKLALEVVWNWVRLLSNVFRKRTLLIIDEYQKTYQDFQEEGITVPCHESIAETINNDRIFTIISGSKISMLAHDVLTPELYNRIPDETFYPLFPEDAHKLILKYAGDKGYKNIEQDVYKMVGGNPYYIKMLFTPTNFYHRKYVEDKKWSSFEKLEKIYNFEILNDEGEIFKFWEKHFTEKKELLNGDASKQKGLTIKILKYIAEKENEVHLDELEEKFPQVGKKMKEKMVQLRKADLIRNATQSKNVFNFSDIVLPVVLTKMHQKLLLGSSSKKVFEAYKKKWFRRNEKGEKRIERMEDNIHTLREETTKTKNRQNKIAKDMTRTKKNLSKIKVEVKNYFAKEKKIKAQKQGMANIIKGAKAESKFQRNVKKYINAKKGIFSHYELVGNLHDVNVKLTSGRGAQIDLFGELKSSSNGTEPKKCLLIGEMKDRKTKISKSEAQIFIDKAAMLRANYKVRDSICVYVCSGGFWKSALKVLEGNNIFHDTSDKFMKKL